MTTAKVAQFYNEASELINADLGDGLHFGYWRDLPPDSSMADASLRMTQLMIDKVGVTHGQRVLDLGSGVGGPAVELARVTGAEVVGVDLSERHVRLATERVRSAHLADRVTFRLGDASDLPFEPNSFDGAWMLESFFHMPDQAKVLRQLAEVLRPGGRLVIGNLVQRTPLSDDQDAALAELWRVGHVAALHPLSSYSTLLGDAGLALEELLDISDDTMKQTFDAIREIHAARRRGEAPLPNASAEVQNDLGLDGMELFAANPEVGFAIIVATKP
ncbi:methyltransferase domain-containing protein [Nocardia sp. NPDC051052]|uniref:methyltransferase domain-containing protein n=1 Tax=Nocardia sp. NPDC051052 TaxID=3364322 RepID=UPI0037AF663C